MIKVPALQKKFVFIAIGAAIVVTTMAAYYLFAWQTELDDAEQSTLALEKHNTIANQILQNSGETAITQPSVEITSDQQTNFNDEAYFEQLEAQYSQLNQNPNYPTIGARYQEIQLRATDGRSPPSASELIQLMQLDSAWHVSEQPSTTMTESLSQEELSDGRSFIQIIPQRIQILLPGDKMSVPIAQVEQDLTFVVDQINSNNPEAISWLGTFEGAPQENSVMFTVTEGFTMASIMTEKGHYTLKARGDEGWVVRSSALFKGTPGANDLYIPPKTEQNVK